MSVKKLISSLLSFSILNVCSVQTFGEIVESVEAAIVSEAEIVDNAENAVSQQVLKKVPDEKSEQENDKSLINDEKSMLQSDNQNDVLTGNVGNGQSPSQKEKQNESKNKKSDEKQYKDEKVKDFWSNFLSFCKFAYSKIYTYIQNNPVHFALFVALATIKISASKGSKLMNCIQSCYADGQVCENAKELSSSILSWETGNKMSFVWLTVLALLNLV